MPRKLCIFRQVYRQGGYSTDRYVTPCHADFFSAPRARRCGAPPTRCRVGPSGNESADPSEDQIPIPVAEIKRRWRSRSPSVENSVSFFSFLLFCNLIFVLCSHAITHLHPSYELFGRDPRLLTVQRFMSSSSPSPDELFNARGVLAR